MFLYMVPPYVDVVNPTFNLQIKDEGRREMEGRIWKVQNTV